jgi:hypothetical protein
MDMGIFGPAMTKLQNFVRPAHLCQARTEHQDYLHNQFKDEGKTSDNG